MMDEASFIKKCREGDPSAQIEMYHKYSAMVGRVIARFAGPDVEVEDIKQETFIRAYESILSFSGNSSLSTWLCSIAVNVTRSKRRKAGRRKAILGAYGKFNSVLENVFGNQERNPMNEMEKRYDAARFVYSVLDVLPDKFREVLIFHEMEEMSGPEIAVVLGIKENTVWTRLHRARHLFKAKADQMGYRKNEENQER